MTFNPVTAIKTAAVTLTAFIASTMVMPATPASAAQSASATFNGAGDLIVNGTTGYEEVHVFTDETDIVVQLYSNGSLEISRFTETQLRRDVIINLRGGSGLAELTQIDIPRNLRVSAGAGENIVDVRRSEVGGNLTLIDTNGSAEIGLDGNTIEGRTSISTGAGLTRLRSEDNYWGRNFTIRTASSGWISANVTNDAYKGPFRLTAGNSSDEIDFDGSDLEFKAALIDLRGGADELNLDRAMFGGRTTIRGGSGNDYIGLSNSTMTSIYTIDMGAGNDTVFMEDVTSASRATVNGGSGGDDLLGVVRPVGQPLRVIGVEGGYGY